MQKKNLKTASFSLIEIIIALVIVGLLAAGAAISYKQFVEKGRSSEAIIDSGTIKTAEERLKLAQGQYLAANSTEEINRLLALDLSPKYYEYKVVGVTDDNFIIIAQRIGEDLQEYLKLGQLPPQQIVLAMDKGGMLTAGYGQYLSSGASPGSGTGTTTGSGTGTGGITSGDGGTSSGTSGGTTGSGTTTGTSGSGTGSDTSGGTTGSGTDTGTGTTETQPVYFTYTGTIAASLTNSLNLLKDVTTPLRNSRTPDYFYDLIQSKNINLVYASSEALSDAIAMWMPTYWKDFYPEETLEINTIYINQDYANNPEAAVAAVIIHEATHADYDYYTEDWVTYTLANHPGVSRDDLAWLWDSVAREYVLKDTQDQELNCFIDEVLTWKQLKGTQACSTDLCAQLDYWEDQYDLGVDVLLTKIQQLYPNPPYLPYLKGEN